MFSFVLIQFVILCFVNEIVFKFKIYLWVKMKQKSIPPLPLHPRLKGCVFTCLTFTCYDFLAKKFWLNLCFDEVEGIYQVCPMKSFCLNIAS